MTDEEADFMWPSVATMREYGEETDSKITSKQLLRIARMRRDRERLVAEFGEKAIASEYANCLWGVFQKYAITSRIDSLVFLSATPALC
jgi:hypothetical protein